MQFTDFDKLAMEVHGIAVSKGFWGEPINAEGDLPPVSMDRIMAKLALAHSEITEILEALRKNKGPDAVNSEFADTFIRLLDLWAALYKNDIVQGLLQDAFDNKVAANLERPYLHGHKWG
jgi:NTP pyrophosphatase (non-canonical NTP hydrolase)